MRRTDGRNERDARAIAADVEVLSAHVQNLRIQVGDLLTDLKMLDAITERVERRVAETWARLHSEEMES